MGHGVGTVLLVGALLFSLLCHPAIPEVEPAAAPFPIPAEAVLVVPGGPVIG